MAQEIYKKSVINITKDNAADWQKRLAPLKEITCDLMLDEGVHLKLDALVKIGGFMTLCEGATLEAGALTTAGEGVCLYNRATLNTPVLTKVEGKYSCVKGRV